MRTHEMTDGSEKTYFTCAETAKFVREALKKSFPGFKFSVRSKTYSGGASIDISWTDGPTTKEVEPVAKRFEGAGFDGMIDLKYHHSHYLLPDGTVRWARTYGHSYENPEDVLTLDDLPEGTKVVHFGADYIFCHRSYSEEFSQEILDLVEAESGVKVTDRDASYNIGVGKVYGPGPDEERFGAYRNDGGRTGWGERGHSLIWMRGEHVSKFEGGA